MDSLAFDRIAEQYDETRGGLERGSRFAAAIDAHLPRRAGVLEFGVGTGLVAGPLGDLGHRVIGIDLSRPMLQRAQDRMRALVEADAAALPAATDAFDAVVAVWAVHLVGDQNRLFAETARVLGPDGVFLVVSARPDIESNDLTDRAYGFARALRPKLDRSDQIAATLTTHGFTHEGDEPTDHHEFSETPNERAAGIEARIWSSLWDLDDDTWASVVQPVIDDLRALPEPDRPRQCRQSHILSAYRGPS